MTTITPLKFTVGTRVVGTGRNGCPWPSRPTGRVTHVWPRGEYVRVQWDGCRVEDDMRPAELEISAQGSGPAADVTA